jgi:hypothetical protein
MTNKRNSLSSAAKVVVGGLLVATLGVVVQRVSGVGYPTIPPVFYILLVPAALVAFGRWRWTPAAAVLAGLFLTVGLFLSGESDRLFEWELPGGSAGLWIQTAAVTVAAVAGAVAVVRNYRPSIQTRAA